MKETNSFKFYKACDKYIAYLYFEQEADYQQIKQVTKEVLNDAIKDFIEVITIMDKEELEKVTNLRGDY